MHQHGGPGEILYRELSPNSPGITGEDSVLFSWQKEVAKSIE